MVSGPDQLTRDLDASGNVVRWVVIRCYIRADSTAEISEGRARSVNRDPSGRVDTQHKDGAGLSRYINDISRRVNECEHA